MVKFCVVSKSDEVDGHHALVMLFCCARILCAVACVGETLWRWATGELCVEGGVGESGSTRWILSGDNLLIHAAL